MPDSDLDQMYERRARGGININWNSLGVIGSFLFSACAVIWFAASQSASIASNHALETQSIAVVQASVAQLQANEKENDKQRIEILLHLSSIDQTLKDWTHPTQVMVPSPTQSGTTIIQQAPAASDPKPSGPR